MSLHNGHVSADAAEEVIVELIRAVQSAILLHPTAAQGIYSALVHEGRRFSKTPEGDAWRSRLVGSTLVERGRTLLEVVTMGLLDEDEREGLPTRLLDVLAIAIRQGALETILGRAVSEVQP